MFPVSSTEQRPIASNLLSSAQKMEERSPGLHVLAAREFRYPVQQQQVSVLTEQYRKINLLEKFLLRAYTEISPPPSLEELASALGLGTVFIRNTFNDLITLQNINNTHESLYVTEEGKKTLSSETVSDSSETTLWYLIQDLVLDIKAFLAQPLDDMDEELEDLSLYVKKELTLFPTFEFHIADLQAQLRQLGLDAHDPDDYRFVRELTPVGLPELAWKRIAVFVLYDTLKENTEQAVTIQVLSESTVLPAIGAWLEAQVQEHGLSLKALCGLSDDMLAQEEEMAPEEDNPEELIVTERLEEIRQQAITQQRLKNAGQDLAQETGTALQLRDVEIRPAFLHALQEAREQIIIYSPWINEEVVDTDFLALMETLVQKGVHILIGYGIGRNEKREERPMPPGLRQRFRAIQTAEGTPGVIAEWLGNSHAKEIIIDQRIHFSGSHNWLSYRGDRFPRGETVYQVTIATEVAKAYNHLAHRFIEQAKILWARVTNEEHRRALCILGSLGQEQEALDWIKREEAHHLLPLWFTLAQQAISAGHEARIVTPLQTAITLCCTLVTPQKPLLPAIVTALQSVLDMMMMKNEELAATFVRDNHAELTALGVK